MKIITILNVILIFCILSGCRSHEIPIYVAIDLNPISDITKDSGGYVSRELVYKNFGDDPGFYQNIISKIESSSTIKDKRCRKNAGRNMSGSSLSEILSDGEIKESVTFESENSRFLCTVSNGGKFILVKLSAW